MAIWALCNVLHIDQGTYVENFFWNTPPCHSVCSRKIWFKFNPVKKIVLQANASILKFIVEFDADHP